MEKMIRVKTISAEKINTWLRALTANKDVEMTVRVAPYYNSKGVFTPFSYVDYEARGMNIMVVDGRVRVTRTDYVNMKEIEWVCNIAE